MLCVNGQHVQTVEVMLFHHFCHKEIICVEKKGIELWNGNVTE